MTVNRRACLGMVAFLLHMGCSPLVLSAEVRLVDPSILGSQAQRSAVLLRDAPRNGVFPEQVVLDFSDSRVSGITVVYPKVVKLEDVRQALNGLYKQYERASFATNAKMGLWRNEDEGFAVQLAVSERGVVVVYLLLASTQE